LSDHFTWRLEPAEPLGTPLMPALYRLTILRPPAPGATPPVGHLLVDVRRVTSGEFLELAESLMALAEAAWRLGHDEGG